MKSSGETSAATADELYRTHYGRLVSLLARIIGDRGRAEELASDAIYRLLNHPELFRAGENLEGWLYRTAMNLGLDSIKMQSRRVRYERAANIESVRRSAAATPFDDYVRAERQRQVRAVLALLKPRDAQLLILRHMDCSYQEIARTMNLAPESVGTLLARALARFEKQFRQSFGVRS
jgi:RNA polymerase sigma-70 factor (ECF subfamily)